MKDYKFTISSKQPTSSKWWLAIALGGVCFLSYLQRMNISVAATFIKPEFNLTDVEMGWIFGAFMLSYTLFQIPGGIFCDNYSSKRIIGFILLGCGVLTILSAYIPPLFAPNTLLFLGSFITLRFLLGIIQAPTFPVSVKVIHLEFGPKTRGLPNSFLFAGMTLGSALTPPLVSSIMISYGWKISFFMVAAFSLLFAVIWEKVFQDKKGFAKQTVSWFSRTKQALKEAKKQIQNRQVLYLSLAYLCMDYVFYMFIFWFFIYLIDFRGFEILNGGLISIFPFAVGAVGGIIGGVLLDRLSRRLGIEKASRVLAFSALSSAGVLLTLGAYVAHANLAIFLLSICLGLCQSTETLFWTGASTIGGRNSGTVTGILNTGGNLGGLLCTYTVPFIKNYLGWGGALASGSIMAVIAAILWCNIRIQAND